MATLTPEQDPRFNPKLPLPVDVLDLGQFPSHAPGGPLTSAFLIALGDEPRARAAIGPKSRWG